MQENIYGNLLSRPSDDFQATRDGRLSRVAYLDIDLSTARSLAAGTALTVQAAGNVFYADMDPVKQGGFTVYFQDASLATVPVVAGLYAPPGFNAQIPFTQFMVENTAQPGMRARIAYGVDVSLKPGGASQVSVTGSVSVIDGGKARTLAKAAFMGAVSAQAAAAQQAANELWNPVGSGKNLILKAFVSGSDVAQSLNGGYHNAALTTLANSDQPKLMGDAASSVAELRGQVIAQPFSCTKPFFAGFVSANGNLFYVLQEPIVIPPGAGFTVYGTAANSTVQTNFEWFEENQ